ncbi:hypothetical protein IFM53868_09468 [Aspergillus udagawae]|uniref:Uncharacterized protein n=1 Tax=Aspergillus udagawae TaxID=91492 RepID=A0ABQ1BBL2_9EURO|nr:hypothetical protein IFM53868_09468 [Aspergillus udagawae]
MPLDWIWRKGSKKDNARVLDNSTRCLSASSSSGVNAKPTKAVVWHRHCRLGIPLGRIIRFCFRRIGESLSFFGLLRTLDSLLVRVGGTRTWEASGDDVAVDRTCPLPSVVR